MNHEPPPHALPQFSHYVPCCTAKSKRTKQLCRQPAMKNGKCRLHGGKSTGAKTVEGRQRLAEVNLTHGYYTKEAKAERQYLRQLLTDMSACLTSYPK
ncbi:MAG: hypothetical protein GY821_03705 [Gammaproteobacteria bacterium]|nr:hypothetical protein [Gammaproteobacteria bacterium]